MDKLVCFSEKGFPCGAASHFKNNVLEKTAITESQASRNLPVFGISQRAVFTLSALFRLSFGFSKISSNTFLERGGRKGVGVG